MNGLPYDESVPGPSEFPVNFFTGPDRHSRIFTILMKRFNRSINVRTALFCMAANRNDTVPLIYLHQLKFFFTELPVHQCPCHVSLRHGIGHGAH